MGRDAVMGRNGRARRRETRERTEGGEGGAGGEEGTVEFLLVKGFVKKTRENELKFHSAFFVGGAGPAAPARARACAGGRRNGRTSASSPARRPLGRRARGRRRPGKIPPCVCIYIYIYIHIHTYVERERDVYIYIYI